MLSDQAQLFDQVNIDLLVGSGTVWLPSYRESHVYEVVLSELDQ